MTKSKMQFLLPAAGLILGLAGCTDTEGTTARQPAVTSPAPSSPAASAPTNPVTGTVPGTNSTGASPTAPGGSGGSGT
jgi:hypothetical protein